MSNTTDMVANGADLLDRLGVTDWRTRIDTEALDMADPFRCVAGQLYADGSSYSPGWWRAPEAVRFHPAFGGDLTRENGADLLEALRAAWVDYLTP